jgi:hypothetical protein
MMKEGKVGSFWWNRIILMSVGTMMFFTCLLAIDIKTVLAWVRVSSRKTAEWSDLKNANSEISHTRT